MPPRTRTDAPRTPRRRGARPGWGSMGLVLAVLLTGGSASAVALHGFAGPTADAFPTATPMAVAPTAADRAVAPADEAPLARASLAGAPRPASPVSPPASAPARPAAPPSPAAALVAGAVRPLGALQVPDLLVRVPRSLSASQLRALSAVRGVQALTVLDVGTVQLAGRPVRLGGVDPSGFRSFTPQQTAASDPLWQSVARGELAPSYGLLRSRGLALGKDVDVVGTASVQERVGAVAAFAVPGVDLVVSRDVARRLGVPRSGAVLLAAPDRAIAPLRRAVLRVTGRAEATVLRPAKVKAAANGRPKTYRELYIASARYCPGLSWTVLAAIGQIESGHGRNNGPSSAGALGPMQFLPSTWASYGVDGDGDGDADINDPFDAVPAAAVYLCRSGAGQGAQGLYDAVFAYNHADWYVREVLVLAAKYR